jgi:hypothetical protein
MYLRKLVSIDDLISGHAPAPPSPAVRRPDAAPPSVRRPDLPASTEVSAGRPIGRSETGRTSEKAAPPATPPRVAEARPAAPSAGGPGGPGGPGGNVKDKLLAEIRNTKAVFYNTVVAQAQRIDVAADTVTFTFSPAQRTLRDMVDQSRPWLETLAQQIAGRKLTVVGVQADAGPASQGGDAASAASAEKATADRKSQLREQAMADAGVKALLEVFPAEIRDIEEM